MRYLLWLMMLVPAPTSVVAQDAPSLADQAGRCWNISSEVVGLSFVADFDVDLTPTGEVKDIAVVAYRPENEAGRRAVTSASRAIQLCSPYRATGVTRFHMDADDLFGNSSPIDPFKPLGE